jgi:hypothetical protein
MLQDCAMTLIMKITDEGTQYADQLHDLLAEFGVNPEIEDEIDEISLLPAYVLAGASIRTEAHAHSSHMHVVAISVEIADELEDAFYETLSHVLEASDEDEDDEE